MERRRRQKWDNGRRSQNRRPPRGSWQPTVPSWEKEFCKVVGLLDWETLLHMKKFMHLYEHVIKWDDSAGEEAFSNAKKRFWAELHGIPCDKSLPDPDLYIDEIDWDSEIDSELLADLEVKPVISNADKDHDPVIIFGDSLLPDQMYSLPGWGDDEENFKVPVNSSSAKHGDRWEQNWGNSFDNEVAIGWPQYSKGDPWEQNWGNSFDNEAAIGWPQYSKDARHIGNGSGPDGSVTWGASWNNDDGWNYMNNNTTYEVEPDMGHKIAEGEQGSWNDSNVARANAGGYELSDRNLSAQGNDYCRNHTSRTGNRHHEATYLRHQATIDERPHSRDWNSFNSCGPVSHHAAITVGQTWNQ